MGAKLRDQLVMRVPDPSGGDVGWSFSTTVPPIAVIAQLEDLMSAEKESKARMTKVLLSDPEFVNSAGMEIDEEKRAELQALIIERHSADLYEQANATVPVETKAKIADIIQPYCGEPQDFSGLTWDALRAADEPYAVEVLYSAAVETYDRARGHQGAEAQKNSSSSSPS